uniref:rhomboid-related protein 4 isoform X4 n=1 Tax=Myodes glareolus TaxID=447135 RepID=UPI00202285A1|nr:rhomboid-related protein 4 isoform X4 [Myodes glareolus]
MQRRSRGVNVGLLMLLSQVFHVGINNIPPVTLATLALNVWLFLNPLKPLHYSCISVEKCYQQKDWQRLLLSPLHHADDWHLYFNMVSMLWKGIKLERRLGSRWFGYIITTFSLLTGVVYLLLQFTLAEFMNEPDFRRNCAVGFSGVLFALKVLSNHYCPGGFVNVLGFPVPNRFACWAELIAIHFCTPGTGRVFSAGVVSAGSPMTRGRQRRSAESVPWEVGCGKLRAKIKENQRDLERSILSVCGTVSHVARLQSNSFHCVLNPSKVVTGHICSSLFPAQWRQKITEILS